MNQWAGMAKTTNPCSLFDFLIFRMHQFLEKSCTFATREPLFRTLRHECTDDFIFDWSWAETIR